VKKPETLEEEAALQEVLKRDPSRFIEIVTQWIDDDPNDDCSYFTRHRGWLKVGQTQKAHDDINTVIALNPDLYAFWARGQIWRQTSDYRKALADYNHAEALDPAQWQDLAYGLLDQADCHAHLGDETSALACCARLPDDFWAPRMNGAPGGTKDELSDKLSAIAAAARAAANS
jgi:tetratricopeptide (TPR) repeat protein